MEHGGSRRKQTHENTITAVALVFMLDRSGEEVTRRGRAVGLLETHLPYFLAIHIYGVYSCLWILRLDQLRLT
jgi:hypothetical protein